MSLSNRLRGTGVALVTPFTADFKIDYVALGKVIEYVIKDGVEYVVTLGTTGETPTLRKEEKTSIINYTYDKVNSRVPVIVGVGGNNTEEVMEDLEKLPLDKAIAVLSTSPYYNKPSQEGLFQHYKAIAAATVKPILLYNVPGRTGRNIDADTILRLAWEVDNIAGLKEAGGDMAQCMKILRDKPEDFFVVSGDDALALPQIACGMEGVISVAANSFPKTFSEMVRLALKSDFKNAKALNDKLIEAYEIMFAENNPAGLKAFLTEQGLIENFVRLPVTPLSSAWHAKAKAYLSK
ncbi:MAG: 4-hydroxy-tetrahydrodipicolinate synthase [Chitinophagaceae bacterium]